MKRYYLALFFWVLVASALAQSNFYLLSGGVGTGGTYTYTDVKKGAFSFAYAGNLDYHFTPFITAGLEVQKGTLKSQDYTKDEHGRGFTNSYIAFSANAKFRAGEFTDFYYSDFLNYTKGFYLSTGLGIIKNKVDNQKSKENTAKDINGNPYTYTYYFPQADTKPNFLLPINVGIDFYFPDGWGDIRYILNINYQTNFTFGEGLDGYNDPKTTFKNNAPDMYNFLSIGIKYTFGPKGLTGKSIR